MAGIAVHNQMSLWGGLGGVTLFCAKGLLWCLQTNQAGYDWIRKKCQTQGSNQACQCFFTTGFFLLFSQRNVISIFFIGICTETNVLEAVLTEALANHEI